jgi:hypothetical protein
VRTAPCNKGGDGPCWLVLPLRCVMSTADMHELKLLPG